MSSVKLKLTLPVTVSSMAHLLFAVEESNGATFLQFTASLHVRYESNSITTKLKMKLIICLKSK